MRFLLAILLLAATVNGADYYVATNGVSGAAGTIGAPRNLSSAFSNSPAFLSSGDTVWLRGGMYSECLTAPTHYKALAPSGTTFRAYSGEQPVINGDVTVNAQGQTFWGIDITQATITNRYAAESGSFPNATFVLNDCAGSSQLWYGEAWQVFYPNTRIIDSKIYAVIGGGYFIAQTAWHTEVYGSLCSSNGWQGTDRGHGHDVYIQSTNSAGVVVENTIGVGGFAEGVNASGNTAPVCDYGTLDGNVWSMKGLLATNSTAKAIAIGAGVSGFSQGWLVRSNDTFQSWTWDDAVENDFGYIGGLSNSTVTANVLVKPSYNIGAGTSTNGNTVYPAFWDGSHNVTTYPSGGTNIIVRAHKYTTGKGTVCIYNFNVASTILVNLAPLGLTSNQQFEVRSAFRWADVVTNTYTGGNVNFEMTGHTGAEGFSGFPTNGVFVVIPLSISSASPVLRIGLDYNIRYRRKPTDTVAAYMISRTATVSVAAADLTGLFDIERIVRVRRLP